MNSVSWSAFLFIDTLKKGKQALNNGKIQLQLRKKRERKSKTAETDRKDSKAPGGQEAEG